MEKTPKTFKSDCESTLTVAAFLCLRQPIFTNSLYRCIVVRYVAILLSPMKCGEGFLMALKNFDHWCSVVFKQLITSKIKDVR